MRKNFDFNGFRIANEKAFEAGSEEKNTVASDFPKDIHDVSKWCHRIDLLTACDCYREALNELEESLELYPESPGFDGLLDTLMGQVEMVQGNITNITREDTSMDLFEAVKTGDLNLVRQLLTDPENKKNINEQDQHGDTVLIWAAYKGHNDIFKTLLDVHGIDVNVTGDKGRNALMWAANKNNLDIVKYLLATPEINVNMIDRDGGTALSIARQTSRLYSGNNKVLIELINFPNIDPEILNKEFFWAASNGNTELVLEMVKLPKIDLDLRTNGMLPFDEALDEHHLETAIAISKCPKFFWLKNPENGIYSDCSFMEIQNYLFEMLELFKVDPLVKSLLTSLKLDKISINHLINSIYKAHTTPGNMLHFVIEFYGIQDAALTAYEKLNENKKSNYIVLHCFSEKYSILKKFAVALLFNKEIPSIESIKKLDAYLPAPFISEFFDFIKNCYENDKESFENNPEWAMINRNALKTEASSDFYIPFYKLSDDEYELFMFEQNIEAQRMVIHSLLSTYTAQEEKMEINVSTFFAPEKLKNKLLEKSLINSFDTYKALLLEETNEIENNDSYKIQDARLQDESPKHSSPKK